MIQKHGLYTEINIYIFDSHEMQIMNTKHCRKLKTSFCIEMVLILKLKIARSSLNSNMVLKVKWNTLATVNIKHLMTLEFDLPTSKSKNMKIKQKKKRSTGLIIKYTFTIGRLDRISI